MHMRRGGRWPIGCVARAVQTPFTDQWGSTHLQVSSTEQRLGMARSEEGRLVQVLLAALPNLFALLHCDLHFAK